MNYCQSFTLKINSAPDIFGKLVKFCQVDVTCHVQRDTIFGCLAPQFRFPVWRNDAWENTHDALGAVQRSQTRAIGVGSKRILEVEFLAARSPVLAFTLQSISRLAECSWS